MKIIDQNIKCQASEFYDHINNASLTIAMTVIGGLVSMVEFISELGYAIVLKGCSLNEIKRTILNSTKETFHNKSWMLDCLLSHLIDRSAKYEQYNDDPEYEYKTLLPGLSLTNYILYRNTPTT